MGSLRPWVLAGWFLGGLSFAGLSGCSDNLPETGSAAKSDPVEQKKVEDGMKEFMAKKNQPKGQKK